LAGSIASDSLAPAPSPAPSAEPGAALGAGDGAGGKSGDALDPANLELPKGFEKFLGR